MNKMRKVAVMALAAVSGGCLLSASALSLFSASANGTELTNGNETALSLSAEEFVITNAHDSVAYEGTVKFSDCTVDKEATAVYKNKLTGKYYIDCYIGNMPEAGTNTYLYFNFGGGAGNGGTTIGVNAVSMVNAEGTAYVLHKNNRNGYMVSTYVRFVVNDSGDIEVYQERSPIDPTVHTPRGFYDLDNNDFSVTDGQFSISSGLVDPSLVSTSAVNIGISKIYIECEEQGVSAEHEAICLAADSFVCSDKVSVNSTYLSFDQVNLADNAILKSQFEISDEGVATGEKVFETTYSVYRNTLNGVAHDGKKWGVGFGLSKTDVAISSSSKAVAFDYNTFSVFGQENGHLCAYNSNWRTVNVVGYAGGTLEASYICPSCSQTITVSAENVDFNGYFAFGVWGEIEAGKQFKVSDFSFAGKVVYPSSIGIEESDFSGLKAGAYVKLYDKAVALGGLYKDKDILWEVRDGVGSVTDGIFHTDTVGSTTLRAYIAEHENIYTDVTFENEKPDGVIVFDEGLLETVAKGDVVTLSASYSTNPITTVDENVTYSIVEGGGLVDLENGVLTAKGSGQVTLRITSVHDSSCYKDYSFEISALTRYNIRLNEKFDSIESGRWIEKNIAEDSVYFGGGATFSGAFNTEDGKSPKLVYNVPVWLDANTGIAFDITFTARKTVGENKQAVNYGFMFAMPSMDSEISHENVGYLNFTVSGIEMYRSGVKLQPDMVIKNGADFAYNTVASTIRLVAKNDGTLEVYVGKSYGDYSISVEDLYTTYSGFDFNNTYLAFATNEEYVEGSEKAFAARFSNVTLLASTLLDPTTVEITDVIFDEIVLTDLFAINKPVEIPYTIVANYNIQTFTDGKLEIVSGQATVKDGAIIFHTAGDVTFRIVSVFDESVYRDYTATINQLIIDSITIKTEKFVNLTTDSQALDLAAVVVANTYIDEYLSVTFEVVSGNAQIVHKQLRLLDAGKVVIRATSDADPTKYAEFTFEVADANEGYVAPTVSAMGCASSVDSISILGSLLFGSFVLYLIKKRKTN